MSPVDAEELEPRRIVHPHRHHSLLKTITSAGRLLSEAPRARRNNPNDQLELAIHRALTYKI
jgi:hypothetical protein